MNGCARLSTLFMLLMCAMALVSLGIGGCATTGINRGRLNIRNAAGYAAIKAQLPK